MLAFQKKKNLSLVQSLVATMGLSQIVTACGGGRGSAVTTETSNNSSTSTDASSAITYVELEGTSAPDQLIGTGNDATRVSAGDGDDYILTFNGSDYLTGDAGNDLIWANDGDDIIYGGAGNDVIDPGDGDDQIYAGPGDDTIKLSAGFDFEDGGEGNDTLEIGFSSLSIPFTINLQTGRYFLTPQANSQTANFSSIENVSSFASVDLTIIDTIGTNVITLGSGDDTVTSVGGNDRISTGAGDDTVTLGLGNYVVDLGGGDDTLHLGAQMSMIDGGSGTDILSVNASIGVNTLYVDLDKEFYFTEEIGQSFDGQDISLKDFESVTVIGAVASTINGNHAANVISSGSANDVINGNGGNDTLSGNAGDDTLNGGAGNDTLTGGEGDDTYVFGAAASGGMDTVTFAVADDSIDFTENEALENGAASTLYSEGALGNITSGTGLQVFSENITVADRTAGPTEAEIETYLGTNEVFVAGATGDSVYIFADDGTNTYGFLVTEGPDGTDKQFNAADDVGVTFITLAGLSDATELSTLNFVDFNIA